MRITIAMSIGKVVAIALIDVLLLCLYSPALAGRGSNANAAASVSVQRHLRAAVEQRSLQSSDSTIAYNVVLYLALLYADNALARPFENGKLSNPTVLHFCNAVNEQASGNQVDFESAPMGVTVTTRAKDSPSLPADYDCEILQTNRAYDQYAEQYLGEGYFIFEVAVQQTVYVDSPLQLSSQEVTDLVEAGFARGTGGRVIFGALLRQNDSYFSLMTVELLDGSLSAPQVAPSIAPVSVPTTLPTTSQTVMPTQMRTASPTAPLTAIPTAALTASPSVAKAAAPQMTPSNSPNSLPSSMESALPTFLTTMTPSNSPNSLPNSMESALPTFLTTLSPTEALLTIPPSVTASKNSDWPTLAPSTQPVTTERPSTTPPTATSYVLRTARPSLSPTISSEGTTPALAEDERDNGQRPLVLGAIFGGVATILVSCFFLYCICAPRCKKSDLSSSCSPQSRTVPTGSGVTRSTASIHAVSRIPGVVSLDDENESLANTTLGDRTTGGVFQRQSYPPSKKRLVELESVQANDSFDDNSVYTSARLHVSPQTFTGPSTRSSYAAMTLPTSLSRTLDFEDDIVFPLSESVTDSSSEEKHELLPVEKQGRVSLPLDLDDLSVDSISFDDSDTSQQGAYTDSEGNSFPALDKSLSDEGRARQISRSIETGTKGFDPFTDDSSAGTPRVSTESTVGGVNDPPLLILGCLPFPPNNGPKYKATANESIVTPELPTRKENTSRSAVDIDNNSLLRNVLEETRVLSRAASKSKSSPRSVPGLVSGSSKLQPGRDDLDILADNHDFKESKSLDERIMWGGSKNALVASRKASKGGNDVDASWPPERLDHAVSSDRSTGDENSHRLYVAPDNLTDGNAEHGDAHQPTKSSARHLIACNASPATPSELSSTCSLAGTLEADPRGDFTAVGDIHPSDTPVSSPGVLGILNQRRIPGPIGDSKKSGSDSDGDSNPWLFETIESTLGPRSPSADLDSISGRSNKSTRSNRSGKSLTTNLSAPIPQPSAAMRTDRSLRSLSSPRRTGHRDVKSLGSPLNRGRSLVSHVKSHRGGEKAEELGIQPRALEHDLRRLEMQLAEFMDTQSRELTESSVSASREGAGHSTRTSRRQRGRRTKERVVTAPKGKLGLVLANRHDGNGTIVSEVRATSILKDSLFAGDKIVDVDGVNVAGMNVRQITALMFAKLDTTRRLTVVSSLRSTRGPLLQDLKNDSNL